MYERYRELIHNDFRGLDQKTALSEIKTEESFERLMSKKASKGRPGQVKGFHLQKFQLFFVLWKYCWPSEINDKKIIPTKAPPEQQKAAISFTYEEGETVQAKEDEHDESDDSDDDHGLALIEEAMNPSLLSAHDKSMIDNKAMDFKIGPGNDFYFIHITL